VRWTSSSVAANFANVCRAWDNSVSVISFVLLPMCGCVATSANRPIPIVGSAPAGTSAFRPCGSTAFTATPVTYGAVVISSLAAMTSLASVEGCCQSFAFVGTETPDGSESADEPADDEIPSDSDVEGIFSALRVCFATLLVTLGAEFA